MKYLWLFLWFGGVLLSCLWMRLRPKWFSGKSYIRLHILLFYLYVFLAFVLTPKIDTFLWVLQTGLLLYGFFPGFGLISSLSIALEKDINAIEKFMGYAVLCFLGILIMEISFKYNLGEMYYCKLQQSGGINWHNKWVDK